MVIIFTGSPGTGKSIIAKALAKKLNLKYVDVNDLIVKNKLRSKYIRKLDTYEVDVKKLNKFLLGIIKNDKKLIIDSHLSHYLPAKNVDYCIVCKTDIKELKKRLEKRKYSKAKVRENLDSEIFDVCLIEALHNKHKVIVIDTTFKNVNKSVKEIIDKIY
jgi:adenylate kinase